MVQEPNVLERFMRLERVQNIDEKCAKKHDAIFLKRLEDYDGQEKIVVPVIYGFHKTCNFFFDKGIEDFKLFADDKYWVAHVTHVTQIGVKESDRRD